ncbi:MAG: hypothetical protein AMXMBFR59_12760 [Rhodanobacteraceae bacterium]
MFTFPKKPFDPFALVRLLVREPECSHRSASRAIGCSPTTARIYRELLTDAKWTEPDLESLDAARLHELLAPNKPLKAAVDVERALVVLHEPGGTLRAAWEDYRSGSRNPKKTHLGYQAFTRRVGVRLKRHYVDVGKPRAAVCAGGGP